MKRRKNTRRKKKTQKGGADAAPAVAKAAPPGGGGAPLPEAQVISNEYLNYKIDLLAKIIIMDVSSAMNGKLYGPNILEQFPDNWIQYYGKYLERRGGGHRDRGNVDPVDGLHPNLTREDIIAHATYSVIGWPHDLCERRELGAPAPGKPNPPFHGVIDIDDGRGRIAYKRGGAGPGRGGFYYMVGEEW
jgi:hypothetical protein